MPGPSQHLHRGLLNTGQCGYATTLVHVLYAGVPGFPALVKRTAQDLSDGGSIAELRKKLLELVSVAPRGVQSVPGLRVWADTVELARKLSLILNGIFDTLAASDVSLHHPSSDGTGELEELPPVSVSELLSVLHQSYSQVSEDQPLDFTEFVSCLVSPFVSLELPAGTGPLVSGGTSEDVRVRLEGAQQQLKQLSVDWTSLLGLNVVRTVSGVGDNENKIYSARPESSLFLTFKAKHGSLASASKAFFESEFLTGENKYHHDGKYIDAELGVRLAKPVPKVLLIDCGRVDFNLDTMRQEQVRTEFLFPLQFSAPDMLRLVSLPNSSGGPTASPLPPAADSSPPNSDSLNYSLTSVACIQKLPFQSSGHFQAYVRGPINPSAPSFAPPSWRLCDDAKVTGVSENEVSQSSAIRATCVFLAYSKV